MTTFRYFLYRLFGCRHRWTPPVIIAKRSVHESEIKEIGAQYLQTCQKCGKANFTYVGL